jgi:hypothetical protein
MRSLLVSLAILVNVAGRAGAEPRLSAARAPEESFLDRAAALGLGAALTPWDNAWMSRRQLAQLSETIARLPAVPEAEIVALFERIRDERIYPWSLGGTSFPRRITWLYPDDGCFARADVFIHRAGTEGRRMAKVFAFGDLLLPTAYHPERQVSWWFHVAPLVRSTGGTALVLDPAIEPERPLPVAEWAARFGLAATAPGFAVCSTATYGPEDACREPHEGLSMSDSVGILDDFFDVEWRRVRALGLQPDRLLGADPPWQAGR